MKHGGVSAVVRNMRDMAWNNRTGWQGPSGRLSSMPSSGFPLHAALPSSPPPTNYFFCKQFGDLLKACHQQVLPLLPKPLHEPLDQMLPPSPGALLPSSPRRLVGCSLMRVKLH